MMKLFNTLSREIEEIRPLKENTIKMYTCGLTVYSQPQIGNWVAYIYSDILHRTLLASGYQVDRVQNITDVGHLVSDDDSGEDKMEKGAKKEGLSAWEVADKYIKIADTEAYSQLKLLRPSKIIRATELIQEQIDFVSELESKGFTYQIADEGVYFDTSKLDDYGKLAQLDISGLKAGARVDITGKKNVTDFALWKFSPRNKKRDMEWESPWGKGFPGWHLECSVIARQALGDQLDIHTGGIDHIPVHHTNEIAQTESLTGKQFVKYWFHNNHIKINGSKMAKSLGNSYTLSDLTDKSYDLQAFKLMVISSHYQTEGNFSFEILDAAQNLLLSWYEKADLIWQVPESKQKPDISTQLLHSLQSNLSTPETIKIISEYLGSLDPDTAPSKSTIVSINELLGIQLLGEDASNEVKSLISDRQTARKANDWAKADEIRDNLRKLDIGLNDKENTAYWYRTRA